MIEVDTTRDGRNHFRYIGDRKVVEQIETILKNNAICFKRVRTGNLDNLFGVKSIVETVVYDVMLRKQAYVFPIRFFYDNRDGSATIDMKDHDLSWLLRISPEIVKLLGELKQCDNNSVVK